MKSEERRAIYGIIIDLRTIAKMILILFPEQAGELVLIADALQKRLDRP